jgi:hypothetical protein
MPVQTRSMARSAAAMLWIPLVPFYEPPNFLRQDSAINTLKQLLDNQLRAENRVERVAYMFPLLEFFLTEDGAALIRGRPALRSTVCMKIQEFFQTGVPIDLALLLSRVYTKYFV